MVDGAVVDGVVVEAAGAVVEDDDGAVVCEVEPAATDGSPLGGVTALLEPHVARLATNMRAMTTSAIG